jgi:hypothetical protein
LLGDRAYLGRTQRESAGSAVRCWCGESEKALASFTPRSRLAPVRGCRNIQQVCLLIDNRVICRWTEEDRIRVRPVKVYQSRRVPVTALRH